MLILFLKGRINDKLILFSSHLLGLLVAHPFLNLCSRKKSSLIWWLILNLVAVAALVKDKKTSSAVNGNRSNTGSGKSRMLVALLISQL